MQCNIPPQQPVFYEQMPDESIPPSESTPTTDWNNNSSQVLRDAVVNLINYQVLHHLIPSVDVLCMVLMKNI